MIKISDIIGDEKVVITQEQGIPWIRNPAEIHNGIDLALPKFALISAPMDGDVTRAGYHRSDTVHSFGNRVSFCVYIDNVRIELYFAHLDGCAPMIVVPATLNGIILTNERPRLYKRELIGWVGSTGASTGEHLHLGVRDYESGEWLKVRNYVDFGDGAE